ncbi:hypothetical protein P7K49_003236, partial [Saguinus oedipus]
MLDTLLSAVISFETHRNLSGTLHSNGVSDSWVQPASKPGPSEPQAGHGSAAVGRRR